MKKEIREVKDGIVQITTVDERWYVKAIKDDEGIPKVVFVPSVTWVAGHYPKGIAFYKWLAGKGWDEAESLKQSAGDKGSRVHKAIENLLNGEEVRLGAQFDGFEGKTEELSADEYACVMAFTKWFESVKPEIIKAETTIFSEKNNFAGTIDFICKIGNENWIIDFKTSQYIWPEYELQLSAYKKAMEDLTGQPYKIAILQIGYKRNKNEYKFTELEDKFDLFLSAQKIWINETAGQKPSQKDFPIKLKLDLPKKEEEKKEVKKRKYRVTRRKA
ncbi:MAG: PD-(D/E)XK nuclease family protein [bacterium]